MSEKCYFCGGKAVSREHAPPRLMFKGFECDSITVPSCKKHNSEKSGDDQAIVNALLQSIHSGLDNGLYGKNALEDDVATAILKTKPSFKYTKRKVSMIPFLSDQYNELLKLPHLAYFYSGRSVKNWIGQLSAALLFDAARRYDPSIYWDNINAFSPNWVQTPPASFEPKVAQATLFLKDFAEQLTVTSYSWLSGWSARPRRYPPDIYFFKFAVGPKFVVFQHVFYKRYKWYIKIPTGKATIEKLLSKEAEPSSPLSEKPSR